ncbi:MAG: P-II family nitrogen regulator [Oscillospiraceae bacterium]|nr:P-II family nitrogen regulator [Oscillospiraceae bacterium]
MEDNTGQAGLDLELAVVIIDFGLGSKVMKLAKHHGIPVGLVALGMGTLRNRILEFLQLADVRKEVVIMVSESSVVSAVMDAVHDKFHFDKPFHGIGFTMPILSVTGLGKPGFIGRNSSSGGKDSMYQSIIVIVDRGKADQVMETATKAGARGGTVIKARSSAEDYDNVSLFHIDIEPEKELVMILAAADTTEAITAAIRAELEIDEGRHGVILCQDVNKTYGVK